MASPYPDRVTVLCSECGGEFQITRCELKRRPNACCSKKCGNERLKKIMLRDGNPAWRGGRTVDPRTGYAYVLVGRKKYRLEHRVVVEQAMGVMLDRQTHVHHENRRKGDNAIENLKPLTPQEHRKEHALESWGKRGADKCSNCGRNDRPHKSHGLCSFCYERQRPKRTDPRGSHYLTWGTHSQPPECVECGSAERPPVSRGVCQRCYGRMWARKRRMAA